MADNRVRITLKIGETTVEIEGSESYVEKIMQEPQKIDSLITKVAGVTKPTSLPKRAKGAAGKENKPKKTARKEGYEMVKDLVLSGEGDKLSLREFYSSKNPTINYERNAVFCYYLLKSKNIKPIGINHVYTCYKEMNQRVPSLVVSLSETSQKGWLDTSDMSEIKITPRGENYVEYDLPKTTKSK